MKYFLVISGIIYSCTLRGQQANQSINTGNQLYRQQQYEKAKKEYTDAIAIQPSNNTIKFNLANTAYRMGNTAEAIRLYDEITKTENDATLRSKAYYNKGAILSKQKKLEESIEAYKSTLRLNPQDKEARENLQKALLELKKKQPPKKQEQKKQEQKQKQQPPMSRKEAEQRLKMLEQKEKQVQQRLQQEKSKSGVSQPKDW